MATVPVSFFFQDVTGYGWTERYWYSGTQLEPQVSNNVNQLLLARLGMATTSVKMTHIRMGSAYLRAPYIFQPPPSGWFGTESTPTAPSEVALLTRLTAQPSFPFYNRPFLRGIPERVVQADSYVPDDVFSAEFANYRSVLINGLWHVVGSLNSAPPPDRIPIAALTPTPPRGYTFTAAAGAFTPPCTVRVRDARVPGYNGIKRILKVKEDGITYVLGGASPVVADANGSQTASLVTLTDNVIGDVFVEGLTRRGAGRPFGLSRGRQPTLYSLRR